MYDIDRFRHPLSEIVKRLYVYSDFFIFVLHFNGFGFYNRKKKVWPNVTHYFRAAKICFGVTRRGGSRGRVRKKKTMWFIGVEVEQETSAPPPQKYPGCAPDPIMWFQGMLANNY